MKTFMNEITLNKVMDEVAKFEKRAASCSSVFTSKFEVSRNVMERNLSSIMSDVWSAERIGYLTHDEAVGIYGDIERMKAEVVGRFRTAEEERVGEDEYTIRWIQHCRRCTREEAEKEYFEEWVD